ncbi:site-specific integrase [Mesorhizobium sp. J428]|uniref:tyrosine-type recombinase/integrase n=1 Tax=Mesorhizobium sp. J428 TaxID=2898440 RepID=UPI0021517A7B|nr:site-specific integrase [Mesorhizobium sp. J428]MCR5859708.1 integrase arm-type DNA-binding domain-containing protein [Mesorhizobium sp. J428]
MARTLSKLSAIAVRGTLKSGRHSDGGGLYLNVGPTGGKSWLFMWTPRGGKRREMGLGAYPTVSLADARVRADQCRRQVAEGRDPLTERDRGSAKTFGDAADQFIASMVAGWRNEKHADQWRMTLGDTYCRALRSKAVAAIDTQDVLEVLNPIWQSKAETAARLRGRIERVLDFAQVKGWRSGENPARWRGHLRNALPARQKLARGHHAAMAYTDVPAFVARLQRADAMAARGLEFLILTAARSGEVLGARFDEFDLAGRVWTVPAARMKAGKVHRVPLSDHAVTIVTALLETRVSDFVFPGERPQRPLSVMAFAMLMRRMKVGHLTPHGFRSAFRDWCGDATTFPRELAEAALAHRVGDDTEVAYRRSDALARRRKLMDAWARYLARSTAAKVIDFPQPAVAGR